MSLVNRFKEWLMGNEEREEFQRMWRQENAQYFDQDNNSMQVVHDYHLKVAFYVYKLEQKVDELQSKLESL